MSDIASMLAKYELHRTVRESVELKQVRPREYRGLCPFHKERTPSFDVIGGKNGSPDWFFCHGCGAHGTLWDWLERMYGMDGKQVYQWLAGGDIPLGPPQVVRTEQAEPEAPAIQVDWTELCNRLSEEFGEQFDLPSTTARRYLEELELSEASVSMLGAGWMESAKALTFPMRDHKGAVIGVRVRNRQGKKWAVSGSKNGLFFDPENEPMGQVAIVEGPTDTAALIDIGIDAIGRASATSCVSMVMGYFQRFKNREIVVVADNDEAGMRGANQLADQLLEHKCGRSIKVIRPLRGKDSRAWKQAGLDLAEWRNVTRNAKGHSRSIFSVSPGSCSTRHVQHQS